MQCHINWVYLLTYSFGVMAQPEPLWTGYAHTSKDGLDIFIVHHSICNLILQYRLKFHQYDDDIRMMPIYITVNGSRLETDQIFSSCTTAVYNWLLHNSHFPSNPDKSESDVFELIQLEVVKECRRCQHHWITNWFVRIYQKFQCNFRQSPVLQHECQQRVQGLLFPHSCTASCLIF